MCVDAQGRVTRTRRRPPNLFALRYSLFDHLVGGGEPGGNGEAERLCGLEIDGEFKLGRAHDWQVGRRELWMLLPIRSPRSTFEARPFAGHYS